MRSKKEKNNKEEKEEALISNFKESIRRLKKNKYTRVNHEKIVLISEDIKQKEIYRNIEYFKGGRIKAQVDIYLQFIEREEKSVYIFLEHGKLYLQVNENNEIIEVEEARGQVYTILKTIFQDSFLPFYPRTNFAEEISEKEYNRNAYFAQRENLKKVIKKMEEMNAYYQKRNRVSWDLGVEWDQESFYIRTEDGHSEIKKEHRLSLYDGNKEKAITSFNVLKNKEKEKIKETREKIYNTEELYSIQERFFFFLEELLLQFDFSNRIDMAIEKSLERKEEIYIGYRDGNNGYKQLSNEILKEISIYGILQGLKNVQRRCESRYFGFEEEEEKTRKRKKKKL